MRKGMLALTPTVWFALGLLVEEFHVYHALNVGSVEPFAFASLWLVSACCMVVRAASRSGRADKAICLKSSSG